MARGPRSFWVVAAALAAHATALLAGFIWLDHAHIESRYALAAPGQWLELFRRPFAETGFYRPLMAVSLSVDALGGSVRLYHAHSLAWHAAASLTVALAGEALGFSRRASTLAALLFAVHPLGSLSAGAIAFRSEAMIGVALFGLVASHLRGRAVLAALCVLFGALTKETALVLGPLFIVAMEAQRRERAWKLLGAEAAALGLALVLRLAYAPSWHAVFPKLSLSEAVGTRLAALAKSTAAVVLPVDPSVCDAFRVRPLLEGPALLGAAFALGLAWLAWRRGLTARLLALAILPSLQLVPTLRWWSPHYLYVPLAFAALLVAERIEEWGKTAFAASLAGLVVLAGLSWNDGRRLRDDEAFWTPEVRAEPACREGHFYLGEALRQKKQFRAAAEAYEAALAPHPGMLAFVDLGAALQNLGAMRLELGELEPAGRAFEAALEQTHGDEARRRLRHNLAVVALESHDPAKAERVLRSEAERHDGLPESVFLYAKALDELGRHEDALAVLQRLANRPKSVGR